MPPPPTGVQTTPGEFTIHQERAVRQTTTVYGGNRVSRALLEFLEAESAGGIIMLAATAVALVVANSPLGGAYDEFWHLYSKIGVGTWELKLSLLHLVNDGLMAVFFLLVGLEIKREILFGELASVRRAAVPVIAAAGGAFLPAAIYAALNAGGPAAPGWGIPMATDIAFAVTLLALLGSRAPLWLKSFVTAVAIADDIMAVLIIALFYSGSLDVTALVWAGGCVGVLFAMNRIGFLRPAAYLAVGMVLWYFVLQSGVHATIAGVVTAAFVPASLRPRASERADAALRKEVRDATDDVEPKESWQETDEREAELEGLATAAAGRSAPLYRLEHAIHPWSAFVILPIFAFANAGVAIPFGSLGASLTEPLTLGIILGLVVGKQVGVTGAAWLAVRLGIGRLPDAARWRQIWGGGALAGIGFTMSIFIASLAFEDPALLEAAKLGILMASLIAAGIGMAILVSATRSD